MAENGNVYRSRDVSKIEFPDALSASPTHCHSLGQKLELTWKRYIVLHVRALHRIWLGSWTRNYAAVLWKDWKNKGFLRLMLFSSFRLECIRSASIYLALIRFFSQKQITFPLNSLWPALEPDMCVQFALHCMPV